MANPQVYSAFKNYVSRLQDVLSIRRTKKTKPRLVISAPFDFKKEDSVSVLPGISGEELYVLREKAAASIVGSALTHPYETYSDSATLAPSSVYDLHFGGSSLNRSTSSFDKASIHRHHQFNNSNSHLPKSMTAPMSTPMSVPMLKAATNLTSVSSSACSSPTVHHMMMAPPTPTSIRATSSPSPSSPARSGSPMHQYHSCCRRCKIAAAKEQHQQRIGGGVTFYPPIVLASTEPYAPAGLSFPSSSSSASSISSRD
ncbi:hypothetical protein SEUCBS140593_001070 [Sporothrix eucalyptigena]|uniref:Uncharacterized protein n=1 Tax=Sporothrix eucalyptigena TaxID=1812306 RepID=A0ABP0AV51_9PEZI